VTQHAFLSDSWIAEARKIRDEFAARTPEAPTVRINMVVTDVPFGAGTLNAHLDSSSGQIVFEEGHLDKPDATVTSDYVTIRTIFVEQDQAAAMQAFMGGKIRVQGDLAKLLALQAGTQSLNPDDEAIVREAAARVRAMTQLD
jgi:hypothetical protein